MSDRIEVRALVSSLRTGRDDLLRLRDAVLAGVPWPLSDTFGVEPEAHWGPPEVLAHLAEMIPFWTGEIARVLDASEEPAPFGRVASDPIRIGLIERDRTLPPAELLERIDLGTERLARRLESLAPGEARRRGVHPTLGEFTVAAIADAFVAKHLADHVVQLRDVLGRR